MTSTNHHCVVFKAAPVQLLDLTWLPFIQQHEENLHPSSSLPSFTVRSCVLVVNVANLRAGTPSLVRCRCRQWPGSWHLLLESGSPASLRLSRCLAATQQSSLHLPPCTEVVCVKTFNQVFSCQAKRLHHFSSGLNVSFDTFPEEICYFDRLPRPFGGFWASQA